MNYKLEDLIDIELFQHLQNRLNEIYSFPSAIIDNEGRILTATAWQDICTQFHRKNPECAADCLKSDQYILSHMHEANPAVSYRCPRGLVDYATPIIIDGVHYGNYFTGQFFLEKPDMEFFKRQAQQFGFDEKDYLEAVRKVPIWTEEQLKNYLYFIKGIIAVISESGLQKLKSIESRKQIEESKERASTILQEMSDGFWIANPEDGAILDVNDTMCRMVGYTRDELLKMSMLDLIAFELPEFTRQRVQPFMKAGSARFEANFRHKNGAILDIEVNVTYLPARNLFFCFHRDITERKKAEKALEEEIRRRRVLFEQLPDGLVLIDPQTARILEFNTAAHKQLGYTREEFSQLSISDLEGLETAEGKRALVSNVAGKDRVDFETLQQTKQGEMRNIQVTAQLVEIGDQKVHQSIWRDITERKQLEQEMTRIMAAFDAASEAIGISDAQGRHLYQNRAFARLFGYETAEELRAAGNAPATTKDPAVAKELQNAVANRKSWTGEMERVTKDGRVFLAYERANAITDNNGNMVGIVGIVTDITERKKAEDTLRLFKESVDNSSDAIRMATPEGVHYYQNKAFDRLFGAIGSRPQDSFYVDKKVGEEVFATIKAGARWSGEVKMYDKDGQIRDISLNAYPNSDERGRVTALVEIHVDITERTKMESALRESEERLSTLFSSMTEMVALHELVFDATGKAVNYRLINCNTAYTKITGIPREMAIGKLANEVYRTPAPPYLEEFSQVAITGQPYHFETYFAPMDKHFAMSVVSPQKNQFATITLDITKRKATEKELRETKERYDYATMIGKVGTWDWNIPTGHMIWSDETYRLMDLTPGALCPSAPWCLERVHPEDRDFLEASVKEAWHDMRPYSRDCRMVLEDGKEIVCQITGKVEFDSNDNPVRMLGTIQDITDQKRAEQAQRELQERLQRSEKMEALGVLAGGVAHDLNNTLGVFVGYAELLYEALEESDPRREDARNIIVGGERAAAIVQDLLTMARRGVQTKSILNLNKIVTEYLKSPECAKIIAFHPHVRIKTELEESVLPINGSQVHLSKTLMNLVNNAAEAMPSGGELLIRTESRYLDRPISGYDMLQEGDYVLLSVSDEGEGITDEEMKHIFEPFYTKKVMGRSGTGLGLSVVWGAVKDHNGYIDVQSQKGKGTKFHLYFPVTQEKEEEKDALAPSEACLGHGESILVADDIEGQRTLAQRILEKLNYRVNTVSTGEEAVAYLKQTEADLVILDMIMDPGMDGFETYRQIVEIRPKQKAIIVSGYAETDRVKMAQALGAGAFVKKPYIRERLGLAVRKELDGK